MTLHDPTLGERKRHQKVPPATWRCKNGHAGLTLTPITRCAVGWCSAKLEELSTDGSAAKPRNR